jgi:hypothetical protein
LFFQFSGSFSRVVFEIDTFFMWIFYVINFLIMQLTVLFWEIYFFPLNLTQKLPSTEKSIYHPFNFPFYMELRDFEWVWLWRGLMEIEKHGKDQNDIQDKFIHIFSSIKFSHRCQKLAKSFEKLQANTVGGFHTKGWTNFFFCSYF